MSICPVIAAAISAARRSLRRAIVRSVAAPNALSLLLGCGAWRSCSRINRRITLDDIVRVYDGDTRVAEHRLQPAAQGWVTVPAHHTALWRQTLEVERRPLAVYEEVVS